MTAPMMSAMPIAENPIRSLYRNSDSGTATPDKTVATACDLNRPKAIIAVAGGLWISVMNCQIMNKRKESVRGENSLPSKIRIIDPPNMIPPHTAGIPRKRLKCLNTEYPARI